MSWPCVLPHRHDPDRPRPTEDGLMVCRGCLANLEQVLAELPAQYRGLSVVASGGLAGAKVSGSPEARLPINPAAAEARRDILWKLVSWLRLIAEERGISEPTSNDIGVVTCWLLVHLRWACAQPWVDEYALELRGMRGRALSLLFPSGRRRIVVGACIERAEGPVTPAGLVPMCPGMLTATVARTDDILPSSVDCDVFPDHTWEANRWPALGVRLHGALDYDRRAVEAFAVALRRAG